MCTDVVSTIEKRHLPLVCTFHTCNKHDILYHRVYPATQMSKAQLLQVPIVPGIAVKDIYKDTVYGVPTGAPSRLKLLCLQTQ